MRKNVVTADVSRPRGAASIGRTSLADQSLVHALMAIATHDNGSFISI
jgi:hypothetical protein